MSAGEKTEWLQRRRHKDFTEQSFFAFKSLWCLVSRCLCGKKGQSHFGADLAIAKLEV